MLSGLDSFCFQDTKDESHLHMAWEQDYHMQDPGRLALFDEYLEMSEWQWVRVALFIFETINPVLKSSPIWLCNTLCGRISAGSAFRTPEQRGWDSLGRLQNGHTGKKAAGGASRGYRCLVRHIENHYLHRCRVQRLCHRLHKWLHSTRGVQVCLLRIAYLGRLYRALTVRIQYIWLQGGVGS